VTEEWEEISKCINGPFKIQIFEFFDRIHEFITKIALKLKLNQICISTAMTIFHKFYILNPKFNSEDDRYLSAMSCLLISSKICNQLIPLNDLVKEYSTFIVKRSNGKIILNESFLFEIYERICFIEFEILTKIGFDLNIDLPYKYLDMMVNYVLKFLRNPKFLVISTNFVNDSFKLPLCLYYSPKLIALAGINMTREFF